MNWLNQPVKWCLWLFQFSGTAQSSWSEPKERPRVASLRQGAGDWTISFSSHTDKSGKIWCKWGPGGCSIWHGMTLSATLSSAFTASNSSVNSSYFRGFPQSEIYSWHPNLSALNAGRFVPFPRFLLADFTVGWRMQGKFLFSLYGFRHRVVSSFQNNSLPSWQERIIWQGNSFFVNL